MYGHRCQDTQSPFRVRAECCRVTSSLVIKMLTESITIEFVWLIDTERWHKILYCYRPSSLSHFGHPEVGLGCVSRAAVRPGWGQLDLNTRREGRDRERREPALAHRGRGRPVEPAPAPAAATWLLTTWHPVQRVAGTRCGPGQSPAGQGPGNTGQLPPSPDTELSFSLPSVTVATD